ncbi:uncharacterized protein F4807DRAFT_390568 [Annulohypoxylon truncatum]|uniref:uncharacterized protein n=1 Tax=Annulohypoxylon truncatum TaxID=327061 RepID=UPI0020073EB1|nr:uncharacterized protein F4807DRAFT_390568 [Annulohypoxylon truncatum]KAI1211475.1 hypothetical protein F4807DRAFT_390568 [Annulohypoxylon truncatum]
MIYQHLSYLGLIALGIYAALASDSEHDEVPSSDIEFFNGRRVAPLMIRGVIEPGGAERSFNGTIEEIESQIRGINPTFSWKEFRPSKRNVVESPRKRQLSKILCHVQNLQPAPRDGIDALVNWLNQIASELPVDGNRCTKYSCQKNAALWFCNDNPWWIQQNSITLANYVTAIADDTDCETSGNKDLIQGQAFDTGGFNVIINGDNCP